MAESSETPGNMTEALVPDWLVNLAALGWRVLAIAALVLVAAYVAVILWTVTASVLLAIVIAAVFAPLVLRLRDGGRSRTAAAGITWLAALGAGLGLILLLILALLPVVGELLTRIDAGLAELQASLEERNVPDFVPALAEDAIGFLHSASSDLDGQIVATAAGIATVLILATFLVFYFLRDGDKAWLWIFQAVSHEKLDRITEAGDDALARVGGYLRGTTVLSGLIAISDLVFMLVLGVPLALPLAVLAFFAGYIPYFGGIAAAAIILLVTLGSQGVVPALIMIGLFLIRDLAVRYYVRPSVYRRTVSIHPAVAVIALLAGYEVAGVVGLVAAVPLTAVVLATAGAAIDIVQPDAPPRLPGLVPPWLDRIAQYSWRILVGVGFVALLVLVLTALPLVLLPIIFGMILAATLAPLTAALVARGRSRAIAAALAVSGTFVVVAGVLILAMLALVDQMGELGKTVESGADAANDGLDGQLGLGEEAVSTGVNVAVETIVNLGQTFGTVILVAVVSAALTFYFLRDGGRSWQWLISSVRPGARDDLDAAGSGAFSVLGGYMTGTAMISFVGAFSQFVIMVVLGLPLALPVFVLSFFLSFIPYIGGFISTGIAFLIALAVGSTADIVIMFIWTIAFNLVTGNIVAPLVYGKTVHIHPAIVLVAIPAGSAVAGILGMFIVVPALGVVAVTWRTVLEVMGGRALPAASAVAPEATAEVEPADSS